MGRNDNNSSQSGSLTNSGLEKRVEKVEHTNAVLQDKVDSIGDPGNEIKVVRRGYVKPALKFQKNNIRINACTGEITDPSKPIPAK